MSEKCPPPPPLKTAYYSVVKLRIGATKTEMSVLVVDTSAIINGLSSAGLPPRVVTIPEVLDELKDSASRRALLLLPALETLEPSEESIRASRVKTPIAIVFFLIGPYFLLNVSVCSSFPFCTGLGGAPFAFQSGLQAHSSRSHAGGSRAWHSELGQYTRAA
jgi:PIN domain of ribonuclease